MPQPLGMSTNAENLAHWVRVRREQLDMSQLDVWQLGGPSNTTLTEIENGRVDKLTPRTARKLDAGLLWEPGSARNVWNGGEPVDARSKQPTQHLGVEWLREQIDRAEIPAALRSRLLDALGSTEGRRVG